MKDKCEECDEIATYTMQVGKTIGTFCPEHTIKSLYGMLASMQDDGEVYPLVTLNPIV